MLKIVILCLILLPLSESTGCGPEQTKENEGFRNCCYYDTLKIPTIGVGFNLNRPDAAEILSNYGYKRDDVLKDCTNNTTLNCLTDDVIDDIYTSKLYPEAEDIADKFSPGLPDQKRAAIVDMAYNLGYDRLSKFVNLQKALKDKNWSLAAGQAKNSKWCKQVKRRCDSDFYCILGQQ